MQGKVSEGRDFPDVVTEADLAAERAMRSLIDVEWPTHGVLGEEFGSVGLERDWVWVLDPVDGTRDFATGTRVPSATGTRPSHSTTLNT